MNSNDFKIKILASAILLAGFFGAGIAASLAQTNIPQIWLTWAASSYAPPGYAGKILPAAGSVVSASIQLIYNGKTADLSKQTAYWYGNDVLLQGGLGLTQITLRAPQTAGSVFNLRVKILGTGAALAKNVQIPVMGQVAVIEAPFPKSRVSGQTISLKGIPYFFNVADPKSLNFAWSVNGQTPANLENPDELTVNLGSNVQNGSTLNIGLSIQNSGNPSEAGSKNLKLTYLR